MKRLITIVLVLVGALMLVLSCEKAPFVAMTGPRSFTFTRDGGTQSFTFTCNRDWSVSSSESWIRVSPSSGAKSDNDVTVTITCSPNTTYDPRNATITIRVEELTETISLTQETGLGLLVSPSTFDLTNAEQTIVVEVQQNVNYTVEIDEACKDWVKKGGTKALSTDKVVFNIAANKTYDNREGKITFKQTDGDLVQSVTVKQSQTNGLFITTPEYDLSNEAHTLSVEVKANVQFEVASQAEWIKCVETKALAPSTIVLSIEANESYDNRCGTVVVKQTNGDLTSTITINQHQTDGLFVTPSSVEVSNQANTVTLEIKDNVSYNIVIPDDAKSWISVQLNTQTKTLTEDRVIIAVAENTSYDNREAAVTIKQIDGPLAETVMIKQAQTDGLFITTSDYNVSNDSHTLTVGVNANIEYQLTSEAEWIHFVETKALNQSTITLYVDANDTYGERTGFVLVKQINGNLTGKITITQRQNDGLIVTPTVFSISKEAQTVEFEINNNVPYDIIIPEDADDWIKVKSNTATKALADNKAILSVTENVTFDKRSASITIKQKDGPLCETVSIEQAQTDALMIYSDCVDCEYDVGELFVDVFINVDYEVDSPNWITVSSMSRDKLVLCVSNNDWIDRLGVVTIKQSNGDLHGSIQIHQHSYQPTNEIWYTTADNKPVDITNVNVFGAVLTSNENTDGKGKISFNHDLSTIGYKAFYANNSLTMVSIPSSVKVLAENAFDSCWRLKEVNLPSGLTSIKDRALAGCAFSHIELPETLEEIGFEAFWGCESLESIIVPKSVTSFASSVFLCCKNIRSVEIKASIEKLNGSTFWQCWELVDIVLPDSIKSLGDYEFYECYSLNTIRIPTLIEKIQYGAFDGCASLKEITLPETTTYLGECVFDNCSSLINVYIKAKTPPFVASNTFSSYVENIFVPLGSVEAYKSNAYYSWPIYTDLIRGYDF